MRRSKVFQYNISALLVFLVWFCCELPASAGQPMDGSQGESSEPAPLVLDVKDLPEEVWADFERFFSEALGRAVQKFWEDLGINDPIETELFSVLHLFIERKNAVVSVYVIRPAEKDTRIRCIAFKRDGKLEMRYTCVTAKVPKALAVLSEIDVDGKNLSVRDKLLYYDGEAGWKQWSSGEGDRPGEITVEAQGAAAQRQDAAATEWKERG